MSLNLRAPRILGIIAFVLLLIGFLISIVLYTQIDKWDILRDSFIDAYNADPTFQEDLGLTNMPSTAEEFADDMITAGKNFLLLPVISSLIACAATLFGIIMMNRLPRTSGVLFIIIGVISLLSVVVPVLLITAGVMILRRSSRYKNEAGIPA
ncbi:MULTISPECIES: DUF4064 domain-containing protein [unclassified Niallia]|uniref:DUF4064 domain-containing protein n=1 Tax=Niallia TaxID=2837506 RepID=UPI001EDBDDD4|nr:MULTISPECIES: DUF4064 domain-containing protein [unclassified Niallia]MCM3029014.1 DUF4064 domain-containing protein [Niallia sp. MER 6]MDL0435099.1 DUF4064 domain-containing protein [Niallia sp. SS-2023]UPO88900.1 DUF4064 domain-containing protein [Niallia sp. Man26]